MASLVRYPGGSKNKGGYNKSGPYYVRVWLPNLKKNKLICTYTENRKEAERKLRLIQEMEWMVKAEQSLLLAGLSEHRNDGKLLRSIDEALGLDTTITLEKAVNSYLESCKGRISKSTISSYNLALNDLKKALGPTTRITQLSKHHFEKIIDYFMKSGYNNTTVNIRLRGIRAFIHWLEDNEYVEKIPFKVKLLKINDELPKFLTPDEIKAIYDQVNDPVMLATFRVYEGTGIRLSELFNSRLNGKFLTVIGKGSKERVVPIPEVLISDYKLAIAEFEDVKRMAAEELVDEKAIKRRIQKYIKARTDRITHAFTEAKRDAKIKGNKTLHALRHTFALRMLVELGDIYLVKKLLGHSSVTVTEIYTKFPMDFLKQVFESKTHEKRPTAIA